MIPYFLECYSFILNMICAFIILLNMYENHLGHDNLSLLLLVANMCYFVSFSACALPSLVSGNFISNVFELSITLFWKVSRTKLKTREWLKVTKKYIKINIITYHKCVAQKSTRTNYQLVWCQWLPPQKPKAQTISNYTNMKSVRS